MAIFPPLLLLLLLLYLENSRNVGLNLTVCLLSFATKMCGPHHCPSHIIFTEMKSLSAVEGVIGENHSGHSEVLRSSFFVNYFPLAYEVHIHESSYYVKQER